MKRSRLILTINFAMYILPIHAGGGVSIPEDSYSDHFATVIEDDESNPIDTP